MYPEGPVGPVAPVTPNKLAANVVSTWDWLPSRKKKVTVWPVVVPDGIIAYNSILILFDKSSNSVCGT